MTSIDIGILSVIALSSIIGVFRGLTREVLGVIGWSGAAILSLLSLPAVRHIARQHIPHPMLADGVTLCVTFIVLLLAFSVISHSLSSVVRESRLGSIDRALGLGFGLLRSLFVLCMIEGGLSLTVGRDHYPTPIREAKFSPMLFSVTDIFLSLMPKSTKQTLIEMAPSRISTAHSAILSTLPNALTPLEQVQEPEKTTNALSTLKPQASSKSEETGDKGYNQAQRNEMDRLLQTTDAD